MEITNSDSPASPSNGGRASRILLSRAVRFMRYPISTILEYSGVLLPRPDYPYSPIPESTVTTVTFQNPRSSESVSRNAAVDGSGNSNPSTSSNCEEVSIWIDGEQDRAGGANNGINGVGLGAEDGNGNGNNREASSDGGYHLRQTVRWIDHILPFLLLLFVVFIRQHFQEFAVTVYSTFFLLKSDYVLQKQTALKGDRKITVLVGYSVFFMVHIFAIYIYWCDYRDDLLYPLLMIPPKAIPRFWHAIFVILLNDTMTRLAAMAFKLVLLMYYKNGKGLSFRRQGQMLTLVEYTLLLYRALLPTPVWYRFFLDKEYGSLFSSLTTGVYLTFKLTSIVKKVRYLFAALKALSRKELHDGSYATSEQVNASGDLCAICQEKMHAPILLRCKHIFCEECVSEWFEVERTCPLCRAVVRPFDLQSYADGSTTLFFQLF